MKKVIFVGGSRGITDQELVFDEIHRFLKEIGVESFDDIKMISGGATGPDILAEKFADNFYIEFEQFPVLWGLGASAGFLRNTKMAKVADHGLIIWDGRSNGTAHMIDELRLNGIVPKIVIHPTLSFGSSKF